MEFRKGIFILFNFIFMSLLIAHNISAQEIAQYKDNGFYLLLALILISYFFLFKNTNKFFVKGKLFKGYLLSIALFVGIFFLQFIACVKML